MTDTTPITIAVEDTATGERLDRFLAQAMPSFSRSELQRLIKAGDVLVNDQASKPAYRLERNDMIAISLSAPPQQEIQPEAIELDILYEDDDLAVVNKLAGMTVHPGAGNETGTLVHAALYHWPTMREVGSPERAGIVHRLDKNTSGLIVLAKTIASLGALQEQFKTRTVYKKYLTLVEGIPTSSQGLIDAPIARDPKRRKQMAVVREGRPAQTRYRLIEDLEKYAFLEAEPHTGRTHQIRVHLAWLGHPVVGDRVYGFRKQTIKMKRLFLHATDLHITSPSTGKRLTFHAPLPLPLEDILNKLRQNYR